jgi:cyclin-dependent kinase 1
MNRTLTTPTEEDWPGVTSMPDYKPTFPSWKTNSLAQSVKQMDNTGLDLLQVIVTVFRFNNKSD